MGPKGKTNKSRERQKQACDTASVKVKQMEGNLEQLRNSLNALTDEYSTKTAELLAKEEVRNLNEQIFEIDVWKV